MSLATNRQSGIELLRMFAAFAVVLLHYNDGRAFDVLQASDSLYQSSNRAILFFLESVCICAVDLFVLISGFFLSGTEKRSLDKPMRLVIQLVVFQVTFYTLGCFVHPQNTFELKGLAIRLLPTNYFVILYIVLYLISPYYNRVFEKFGQKSWNVFMLIILMVFSVYPTFVDLLCEVCGNQFNGLSPIGLWGSQHGFNIVNFSLLYFVGAYLKHNQGNALERCSVCLYGLLVVSILLVFVWAFYVNEHTTKFGLRSAWNYHNPIVIAETVSVFLVFKRIKFQSRVVNELSKAAFTCFLLHAYLLPFLKIEDFVTKSPVIMVCHIMFSVIIVYLCSYIFFKLYTFVAEKLLYKHQKSRLIDYFGENENISK